MTDMDGLPNSGELLTEQTVKKTAEKYCLRGGKKMEFRDFGKARQWEKRGGERDWQGECVREDVLKLNHSTWKTSGDGCHT